MPVPTRTRPASRFGLIAATLLLAAAPVATPASPPTTASAPLAAFPADEVADRVLLAELGDQFRAWRTAHFSVLSSAAPARTSRLSETAEDTLGAVWLFGGRLQIPVRRPEHKLTVIFFGDWRSYASYARRAGFRVDESIPGFHDGRANRCILFDYADSALIRQKRREIAEAKSQLAADAGRSDPRDDAARQRREKRLRHIQRIEAQLAEHERLINMIFVRHEIAHQVLCSLGPQVPGDLNRRWLKEGLAMQFESPEPVNHHRLADFLATDGRLKGIGLRDLIADPKLIGPGADHMQHAYAEAWALVYYLVHKHPTAFARYVRVQPASERVGGNTGRPALEDFEAAFGPIDAAFEARWRRYVQDLNPQRKPEAAPTRPDETEDSRR